VISLFKISEVAGKLNVETYVIFEKLLTHADLFKDHTQKIHSISYIDEVGIEIIQALVDGQSVESIKLKLASKGQNDLSEMKVDHEETDLLETSMDDAAEDDEDWLTEEDLKLIDIEKQKLRDEVSLLRRQLIQYDSELKRLDDAISNYQILMREDVDYLMEMEEQLEKRLFQKAIMVNDEEPQTSRFGFMRK